MKKLFFKVSNPNGYPLQLVADLEARTVARGYCLAAFADFVALKSKRDLYNLFDAFISAGFQEVDN